MELERVLTKLKFDESVNGYALITSDGHPFLSFSLPDEVLPQIKGTLRIHGSDLKLVNIMTGKGIVILARIDPRWVLAVLFDPDFQLGGALSRTKAVVDLLVQVSLPPPPISIAEEEDVNLPSEEESIGEIQSTMSDISQETVMESAPSLEPVEPVTTEITEEPPQEPVEVKHWCIVHRGENYKDSVTLESELNVSIKRLFANVGIDILLVVDEKMTVYNLAEHLARPVEKIIEIVKWCVSRKILWVECPKEKEPSQKEIIELPLFEGKIDKVKKKHRPVLELCDGKRTLQEIATELGIPYFEALQMIIPYRGKSVRFIRTDKVSRF
ncbi:MAG: hypothetical protein AM326_08860 [Candidatus Thorarchaeota archaeon SMTZ-45]|nr:MAG: hypothetical protein AM326_08860 [Candidatus Thorarchaeota archaeon SMTZ-45]